MDAVKTGGMRARLTMLSLRVVISLAVLATVTRAGEAQQRQSGNGRAFGFGIGLSAGTMLVGGESQTSFVASGIGGLGIDSRNRFLLMGEFNALEVDNPVGEESFRAIGVLVGGGERQVTFGWAAVRAGLERGTTATAPNVLT